jgi:hypothetical protein
MKTVTQTGTTFTSSTTEVGNAENGAPGLPLMSELGQKLAAKSAPTSAFDAKVGRYSGNPLHDSMLEVFKQ